ncbi:MAG: glycosyltransferase [Phycisphaerales bacterium]|jgi:glycosyltransferase involved in cell wall biosynthesis
MEQISDALVLVFDEGSTLVQLDRSGAFERHRALWTDIGRRHGRLILVTHDRGDEAVKAAELAKSLNATCVCDDRGTLAHEHQDRAAGTVAELLEGCTSAVVQAVGLMSAPTALAVVSTLHEAGIKAALLAEGADLWSRQSICEFGSTSRAALEAAYREQLACTSAHVVLAGCGPVADDLVWRFNLSAERVRTVPMPVLGDTCCVRAEQRDKSTILAFGPATKRARLNVIVDAIAFLRKTDWPDATLKILLDGPEAPALEKQAEELGVPLEIIPSPTAEQAAHSLRTCALMVYAATSETNPPAVFEALSVGTAVVLAVDPLCALQVVHGVSGLRMPPESEAIARAVGGLLMDAPWRDALGAAGREKAYSDHSSPVVAKAMAEAHAAALDIAERDGSSVSAALILAGAGLAELDPTDTAAAWSKAIADSLSGNDAHREACLSAIIAAVEDLRRRASRNPAA